MSHHAKLVLGFYDVILPMTDFYVYFSSRSAPYTSLGNKLYLVSDQGNVIQSSNIQKPTVIFRINEFIVATYPILIKPRKDERDVIIADGTNFHELHLKLVDRWNEPVFLSSPMLVTIKMKPIMEDVVNYG
jgi:hypothetical protein